MNYVVEMLNIRKEFPGVVANNNVTIQLKKGEIHALLGENGAGKSTLMNVLFGLYQPEKGTIKVNGESVKITNPNIATKLGIGMVHQHFMLVDNFTVTQNIILGEEPTKYGKINLRFAEKKVQELSDQYNLKVDPTAYIKDTSVGMQQRVEILKTLYRGAEVLIFDEPTAVLTPQEIKELMDIMKALINEGKSIILITHKLKEIKEICDRCTVIRKGEGIKTVDVPETSVSKLASLMVGREVIFTTEKSVATPTHKVLEIKDLVVSDNRKIDKVKNLSLEVRAGEIVGIAGIDGNGQTELIEAITGLTSIKTGKIKLNSKNITGLSPRKITESGIAHIPEDRQKLGLVLDFSVGENIVLQSYYKKQFSKNKILDFKAVDTYAKKLIEEFDIRTPGIDTEARSLSGGNQQKVIIAREVERSPDLLIAAQPTRGLDVGAIEFIQNRLVIERDQERAILLISYELDEILDLSDRILVLFDGKIVADLDPLETNEQELGLLMAGSSLEEVEENRDDLK